MNKRAAPPKIKRFPAAKQRRLDELLEKNCNGAISAIEKSKLEQLVAEAEQLMIFNASRLADFAKSEDAQPGSGAIPVTVWVQPDPARK